MAERALGREVVGIFTTPYKTEAMRSQMSVYAIEGRGLVGDRYEKREGTWSPNKRTPDIDRAITIISLPGFQEANMKLVNEGKLPFTHAETRRNVFVDMPADELNGLVSVKFKIGEVEFEGAELCTPCGHPSTLSGKEGFKKAFEGRGGLRAKVLSSGVVEVGSELILPNAV